MPVVYKKSKKQSDKKGTMTLNIMNQYHANYF